MNNHVSSALAKLGETSKQITESLKARGIKGRAGKCHQCPIAIYLSEELDVRSIYVDVTTYAVSVGLTLADGDFFRVGHGGSLLNYFAGVDTAVFYFDIPHPVRCFIGCFDGGQFLELDVSW